MHVRVVVIVIMWISASVMVRMVVLVDVSGSIREECCISVDQ